MLRPIIQVYLPTEMAKAAAHGNLVVESAIYILNNDDYVRRHPSAIEAARFASLHVLPADGELRPKIAIAASPLSVKVSTKRSYRIAASERVAAEPQISGPALTSDGMGARVDPARVQNADAPSAASGREVASPAPPCAAESTDPTTIVKETHAHEKVKYVQQVLKLLHITEFVLLIEFTEVAIPVIYCMCFFTEL